MEYQSSPNRKYGRIGLETARPAPISITIPKGLNHSARRWTTESAYAGWMDGGKTTLKGLHPSGGAVMQPRWGCDFVWTVTQGSTILARPARIAQPWAEGWNPGWDSRNAAGTKADSIWLSFPNIFCHKYRPLSAIVNEIACKNRIARLQIQTSALQQKPKRRPQPPETSCFVSNIEALASVALIVHRIIQ